MVSAAGTRIWFFRAVTFLLELFFSYFLMPPCSNIAFDIYPDDDMISRNFEKFILIILKCAIGQHYFPY